MALDEFEEDLNRWLEGFRHRLESSLYELPLGVLEFSAPIFLSPQTSLAEALSEMHKNRVGFVLVGEAHDLKGIFTERDLIYKVFPRKLSLEATPLSQVMTAPARTLPVKARIVHALHEMSVGGFRHLPVLDEEEKVVGVVSVRHILKFLVDLFPDEILNIPPEHFKPSTEEGGG